VNLAAEIRRDADPWLSSIGKLKAGGFEHRTEAIYGTLAEFFAALKADNGFGRYLRRGGQFPGAQAVAALAIRHWTGSTWSEPLFSVPGTAVPQCDRRPDEGASADQVKDQ
jgi:hypothetical protein